MKMAIKFWSGDMGTGTHRDTRYLQLVDDGNSMYINDVPVVVAQLESDMKWWIIPDMAVHNDWFADMGPYDTPEEALVLYKLTATKVSI
jgi:hypothetical protein